MNTTQTQLEDTRTKVPVDVVIIAQNEEANIEHAIESVRREVMGVFVVDSNSDDQTRDIAAQLGAVVRCHEFHDWASQRNWALEHLPLKAQWVFFLDADEAGTPEALSEIADAVRQAGDDVNAMYVRFRLWFLGRRLKYSYESPPILRIVRRGAAKWIGEGAREHCLVHGRTKLIRSYLNHHDRRGIEWFVEKQKRNAIRESGAILADNAESRRLLRQGEHAERRGRLWLRVAVYNKMPPAFRAWLYFIYRYVVRGGILDGTPGLAFCALQGLWYPLLTDLLVIEKRATQ